jgi:hypothetical protein
MAITERLKRVVVEEKCVEINSACDRKKNLYWWRKNTAVSWSKSSDSMSNAH